ncbi:hypothetical protein BN1012_Phect2587 [Candidatus Phaeomarinobacter ectocarpi]|uniref:Uncharacterized protein n=1 Tax=Candidatus Phaeomarinibacter ectocarpi TaxID=1458461 RepID=X5MMY1_9HYPH|nr:hypothetical protein [Candidatus Phaeomarinobacter ectocarpi]CDO60800.1 hypothetical protein BN1012_Phect2587 [Candidatus Phaeomarinobacter ectocarpi]
MATGNSISLDDMERRLRLSQARNRILEVYVKHLLERSGLPDVERLELWLDMASSPDMTADEFMDRSDEFTPLSLHK